MHISTAHNEPMKGTYTMKKPMKLRDELVDEILSLTDNPADFFNEKNLFLDLQKAVMERALQGELGHHLGYPKHGERIADNSRNGISLKTVQTDKGPITLEIPRDRAATFEPQLVKKHQTRIQALDDKIIAMYARGMSLREIQSYLLELYGTELSTEFISSVTDAVMDQVIAWQNRPLDDIYPILYLDALVVKVQEDNRIIHKSLYMAIGVTLEGHKEVLGLWMAKSEGAKFWLQIMTELRNRGVQDIFIACVDGLKGFTEAINSVFPQTTVQLCIVHMIRGSLKYVPWKDRKAVAADLKAIYGAINQGEALNNLQAFRDKWDKHYPTIADMWERNWQGIIPFLEFPAFIRRAIYTTNAIEAANRQIRKIIKTKGAFPNDQAVFKLVFLALQNAQKRWTMPIREWKLALNQFAILYSDRII